MWDALVILPSLKTKAMIEACRKKDSPNCMQGLVYRGPRASVSSKHAQKAEGYIYGRLTLQLLIQRQP